MKEELLKDDELSFLSRMIITKSNLAVNGCIATLCLPENLADLQSEKVLHELKTAFKNAGCELTINCNLQGVNSDVC
ncbi:hypothetical protein [Marinospirillum insulare]|uniref:hypothetical protein n=1 Tax=Marinospirillum insulare TaxID=217169 RepID=UPI0004879195|nr:hypothetical protein [Marinospirillum insulare]